jgi:hypothetical protein
VERVEEETLFEVELPNGLCGDLFGPSTGAHNDNYLLRVSRFCERFAAAQDGLAGAPYMVYGDAAYPNLGIISRPFKGRTTRSERRRNRVLSKLRIVVEWGFSENINLWGFVDFSKQLKLLTMAPGRIYVCAVLLRNANVCCYESKTSKYFSCEPPTLEEYFTRAA